MIHDLCAWLGNTAFAYTLQTTPWIIPASQTVHILAIAFLFSAITLIAFRILGLGGKSQTRQETVLKLAPFVWWAVPVLLATGLLQITAEPERSLLNPVFWLKMSLLAASLALFGLYHRHMRLEAVNPQGILSRGVDFVFSLSSIALWAGIIFAGRMIAYAY